LAYSIGLTTKQLPVFASLVGNDVIGAGELKKFHYSLIGQSPAIFHFPQPADRTETWAGVLDFNQDDQKRSGMLQPGYITLQKLVARDTEQFTH
jgi:hypothetical protein